MRTQVNRGDLVAALATAAAAVPGRPTMEVLSNVRLIAVSGRLTVEATSLDVTVVHWIPAAMTTPGQALINASKLLAAVRAMRGAEIVLAIEGGDDDDTPAMFKVSAGRNSIDLALYPDGQFPPRPEMDADTMAPAGVSDVLGLLESVRWAAANDDTRPNLSGVLLTHHLAADGCIRAVACNGHLLVVNECPADLRLPDGVIVPGRAVAALVKILDGVESAQWGVIGPNLVAQSAQISVAVRLVDAAYPDYRQIHRKPDPANPVLTAKPADVTAAIRVALVGAPGTRHAKFTATGLEGAGVQISTGDRNTETGLQVAKASTVFDAQVSAPAEFNAALPYVRAAAAMYSQPINIHASVKLSPVAIRPVGGGFPEITIMPMRG